MPLEPGNAMNATLVDLVGALKSKGRIAADDVLMLRRAFYTPTQIATEDVEGLLGLDQAVSDRCPEWGDFFASAVVDFVVHQQEPADYVDAAKSTWVMGVFAGAMTIDGSLEALIRVVETAVTVPGDLAAFIMGKVKAAIANRGRVDAASVAVLKRLVFAGGGPGNVGVTRDEADALFDINDTCKAGEDDAWLHERDGTGGFLASMARLPDVRGAMHDILHPFADEADQWKQAEAEMETAESDAATITEEEAKWLLGRFGAGGLGEPEQRLIDLLKSISPPSLDRLSEVMGQAA